MSDEVSLNEGWTLPSYVAHAEAMRVEMDQRYQQRFAAQESAVRSALTSAKEATQKAEVANEKRFESVNEFRATLADQAGRFVTRTEVEQLFRSLDDKVDTVTGRLERLDGRSGGTNATWGYLVGAVVAAGTLVAILGAIIGAVIYVSAR